MPHIKTQIEVTSEDINDLFVTAIEGGINYWARIMAYDPDKTHAVIEETYDNTAHIVTADTIINGLQKVADKRVSDEGHFSVLDFIENHDANDADWIVQNGLFNELRYS